MIKYLLFFILPFSLYASQILSYNIYDRTDRVDLMLTFDTPYSGIIKQSRSKSQIIIKLEDASIESQKIKKISSRFLQSVVITPFHGETRIVAKVPQSVKLIASKTSDGYGLRLRFMPKTSINHKNAAQTTRSNTNNYLSNLPTKKSGSLTRSYIIVIAILIIGILILFYIKKKSTPQRIMQDSTSKQQSPWLFNANNQHEKSPAQTTQVPQNSDEVAIRFQKAIDGHNSVVMLDFGKESYLVLMGNSNILLDKFHENRPNSQEEFESILQNRHEELENFLNSGTKEPLQAYKERAASIIYNDD